MRTQTRSGAWRLLAGVCAAAALLLCAPAPGLAADALAVDVVNASEPTRCAEKDNVYLQLQSAAARRFTVEAVHPAYIGTILVDRKDGRPIRKLELRSADGGLLTPADTALKPRPGKQVGRISA